MTPKDCKKFERCSAPLCPLKENTSNNIIWYPDEEICSLRDYGKTIMIRNQRKISRKVLDTDCFFTQEMLSLRFVVGKRITGIDPDIPISELDKEVQKWIRQHPERRSLSSEQKEKLKGILIQVRSNRALKRVN